jgi:hypothetical protein
MLLISYSWLIYLLLIEGNQQLLSSLLSIFLDDGTLIINLFRSQENWLHRSQYSFNALQQHRIVVMWYHPHHIMHFIKHIQFKICVSHFQMYSVIFKCITQNILPLVMSHNHTIIFEVIHSIDIFTKVIMKNGCTLCLSSLIDYWLVHTVEDVISRRSIIIMSFFKAIHRTIVCKL